MKTKSEDIFSKVQIIIKKILAKSKLNVKAIGCDATCSLGEFERRTRYDALVLSVVLSIVLDVVFSVLSKRPK